MVLRIQRLISVFMNIVHREHTRQRGRTFRHQVHLRRHQRQLHAQAFQLCRGRPTGHGQGIHRLRKVRGADQTRGYICHQDEEEPRLHGKE